MRQLLNRCITRSAVVGAWFAAIAVVAAVALLLGVLISRGAPVLGPAFVFGDTPWADALLGRRPVFGGILPALAGTVSLVVLASLMAVPLGVATGIWSVAYASTRARSVIGMAVDLLAGVPSIVMGLFGFSLILFLRHTVAPEANKCLLVAAFCLAVLVLPYLIRATQNAIEGVPPEIQLIGPSLGFTRLQNLLHVVLPAGSRGILSGIILSVGRIAEDTAVIMLSGAVFNTSVLGGPLAKFEALPFRIYWLTSQYRTPQELESGFGCALVLLLVTATLFVSAFLLRRSLEYRWNR